MLVSPATMGLVRLPWFERVTLMASALTLGIALAAWGLMRVGAYSLPRALGAGVVGALSVTLALRQPWRPRGPAADLEQESLASRWSALALALCLGFGVLYALFPTYFLLGGQDPGPYLAFSARIAKTGGLHLELPVIEQWARTQAPGLLRAVPAGSAANSHFPAVYGDIADPRGPNPLQAQFVHLFTSYTANFFAWRGVEGAVRANAWLASLCLATGFAFVRRLMGGATAFAFLIALGIDPAFVWASRITLTEMLALWLNLSGILLLLVAWDRKSVAAAAVAGVVFGLGILNRLDGGLGALAVLGFGIGASFGGEKHRHAAAAAAVAYLLVSAFAYRDAYVFSSVYWHELERGSGSLRAIPVVTSVAAALALVVAVVPPAFRRRVPLDEARVKVGAYAFLTAIGLWVLFGLFVRPLIGGGDEAGLMRELTWYVQWVAWPLAFLGLAAAVRGQKTWRFLPLSLFALGTLVIYTLRTEVAPEHIWASRRWVPHVIPFWIVAACAGGSAFVLRLRARAHMIIATVALALAYAAPALWFDRLFLFRSMLAGLPEAYERVADYARQRQEGWPVLTGNVQFGSILSYVYDVPTAILSDAGEEALEGGAFAGRLALGYDPFTLRAPQAQAGRYVGQYLQRTTGERPNELVEHGIDFDIGKVGPLAFDVTVPASHPAFRRAVQRLGSNGEVVSNGQRGSILWGPWLTLVPGRYRVEWYGHLSASGRHKRQGTLDVIDQKGKESIGETPLAVQVGNAQQLLGDVDFTLAQRTGDIEFRVRVEPRVRVAISEVRLVRFGDR